MNNILYIKRCIVTFTLLIVTSLSWAFDFKVDGIYYNKNSDGKSVEVTHKSSSDRGYSGAVAIPSTVTYGGTNYSVSSIGNEAFSGCSGLTSVTIPNTVTSIGYEAFMGCSGLTSVTIGNSVTSIGNYAFENCSGLTSVTIGNRVTSIGFWAFSGCTSLPVIDNIRYADTYLVEALDKAQTSYRIKEGTRFIGNSAFRNCSGLKSIIIPESVTSIGSSAFSGCSGLTSITIPDGVTSIGGSTFSGCSRLTSINIPESVTSIGWCAFYGCSNLTFVTIPESVTSFDDDVFSGCTSLPVIDNIRYADTYLVEALDKAQTSYSIKEGTKFIGTAAFSGCTNLTSINIPESVTSIGNSAFSGCSGLTSINIPDGVTSISLRAFYGCSNLTFVTIPESVTSFDDDVFSGCTSLPVIDNIRYADTYLVEVVDNTQTSYSIKEGTKFIGSYTFSWCSALTSINIPNSVTSIGWCAFENCSGLTSITIPEGVTSIHWSTFSGCSGLTSITIPNSVTSIGSSAFSRCSGLTSVSIPESVTSIGDYAFDGCDGLVTVNVNNSNPVSISSSVFSNRANATLYVPKGAKAAYEAADYWKEFKEIVERTPVINFADANVKALCVANWDTNGDGELDEDEAAAVTSLGEVFKNNTTITSFDELQYFTGLTSIGELAFSGCSGLTTINIPDGVTSIGSYAFRGCSGITSVNIPNSVTSIGESAFFECSSLTSITIPESVTSIGNRAFFGCNFRTIVSKPMQPKGFPDTFSQPVYNHTLLYVPQGTYWDYVFNSEWYRFLHIKEFAFDEVAARQAYMLADTDGTNFTVYNAANDKLVTKEYMHQVDETSLGSNWVAEPCGTGMALLNLGAEKYAQISSDGKISLSDTPQELNIEFNDGVATANGRRMMLVLNESDEITEVVTLRYTPSASEDSFDSNAPIYDLMGRRLQQKPTSGIYIQNGKKYLVK